MPGVRSRTVPVLVRMGVMHSRSSPSKSLVGLLPSLICDPHVIHRPRLRRPTRSTGSRSSSSTSRATRRRRRSPTRSSPTSSPRSRRTAMSPSKFADDSSQFAEEIRRRTALRSVPHRRGLPRRHPRTRRRSLPPSLRAPAPHPIRRRRAAATCRVARCGPHRADAMPSTSPPPSVPCDLWMSSMSEGRCEKGPRPAQRHAGPPRRAASRCGMIRARRQRRAAQRGCDVRQAA